MSDLYVRKAATYRNELRQSCAALVGITQGLLADGSLNDTEIHFLRDWLKGAEAVSTVWPGTAIYQVVQEILQDGVVTPDERTHLIQVLTQFLGGRLDDLLGSQPVCGLALDMVSDIDFKDRTFCLTGDFVFGPKKTCEEAIARRGGQIATSVTKKLNYLVVGGLGSNEWKNGNLGTKIEKAMQYKADGVALLIIHEDAWANSLGTTSA